MCAESSDLQAYSVSVEEWNAAQKLCDLLRIFHKATSSESASQFVSISMTGRIFEFLSDSVYDFREVEDGQLNQIALVMQQKLSNYVSQVNCETSRLSRF